MSYIVEMMQYFLLVDYKTPNLRLLNIFIVWKQFIIYSCQEKFVIFSSNSVLHFFRQDCNAQPSGSVTLT